MLGFVLEFTSQILSLCSLTTIPVEELLEYLRSIGQSKKVREGPAHTHTHTHTHAYILSPCWCAFHRRWSILPQTCKVSLRSVSTAAAGMKRWQDPVGATTESLKTSLHFTVTYMLATHLMISYIDHRLSLFM